MDFWAVFYCCDFSSWHVREALFGQKLLRPQRERRAKTSRSNCEQVTSRQTLGRFKNLPQLSKCHSHLTWSFSLTGLFNFPQHSLIHLVTLHTHIQTNANTYTDAHCFPYASNYHYITSRWMCVGIFLWSMMYTKPQHVSTNNGSTAIREWRTTRGPLQGAAFHESSESVNPEIRGNFGS